LHIKEITGDLVVSGQYLIIENQLRTAKNGNGYLALKLGDHTGEVAAKVWDANEDVFQRLGVGKVISVTGIQSKTYQSQMQLDWDSKNHHVYKVVPDSEVDFAQFLPQTPGSISDYWNFLQGIISGITEPFFKNVLGVFFDDAEFVAGFLRFPAALKRHHAYIGGLVEHTAGVTTMCQAAASNYPLINKDMLLTGAILHDIGKVKNYKIQKGFDGTDEGKLIGHLILGVNMVEQATTKVIGQEKDQVRAEKLRNSLLHMLVSHHGIMEWGSPVEPLTLEACILHHADNMDAHINKFLTIIRNQQPGNEWAAYDPGLGRAIYLGNLDQEALSEAAEEV
jgi:3'-5' exoribonuclease